jgi:hypothetical protein
VNCVIVVISLYSAFLIFVPFFVYSVIYYTIDLHVYVLADKALTADESSARKENLEY